MHLRLNEKNNKSERKYCFGACKVNAIIKTSNRFLSAEHVKNV